MQRIAIQMDPPERLNPLSDSTVMLAEAAVARGMEVHYYHPRDLSLQPDGSLTAPMRRWHIDRSLQPWWKAGEATRQTLNDFDAVLMRQDPPFDMEYITATYLLERLGNKVFNPAAAVRNAPEKLTPYLFPQFQPATLVSADREAIRAFHAEHPDMILKPLHGFGGVGVLRIGPAGENLETLLELMLAGDKPQPLVAQPFLPAVKDRELRVLMIDGEARAFFRRRPASSEIRSNMRVGGTPEAVELTAQEKAVAEAVGGWLKQQKILLCGLDLIGGYLGEINVTCPTGLRAAEKLYGVNLAEACWENISSQLA